MSKEEESTESREDNKKLKWEPKRSVMKFVEETYQPPKDKQTETKHESERK